MSAPDLASQDTRDFVEKAATALVMKYVGYPSLSAHEDMCRIIRATLAASAELRSVEEALERTRTHLDTGKGEKDHAVEAALLALRAITGRKA